MIPTAFGENLNPPVGPDRIETQIDEFRLWIQQAKGRGQPGAALLGKAFEAAIAAPDISLASLLRLAVEGRLSPGTPQLTPPYGKYLDDANDFLDPSRNGSNLFKKARLLRLYQADSNLAAAILKHQIAGFHGTRSGALPDILHYGLMDERTVKRRGIVAHTGEREFSYAEGQIGVSFIDWTDPDLQLASYTLSELGPRDVAYYRNRLAKLRNTYGHDASKGSPRVQRTIDNTEVTIKALEHQPQNPDEWQRKHLLELDFPVAVGVRIMGMQKVHYLNDSQILDQPIVSTDIDSLIVGEFLVVCEASLPGEAIPVIAAPAEHHELLQDMLSRSIMYSGAEVVDIEPLNTVGYK